MRNQTITLKLTRRADGRWQKKIDGKVRYFGDASTSESDARKMLLDFLTLREADRPIPSHVAATVQMVCERFIARCKRCVTDGELTRSTFLDYEIAVAEFAGFVGPTIRVADLTADLFGRFRAKLAKRLGHYALDRNIQAVRTMFKWAFDNNVIATQPRYGDRFKKTRAADRGQEQAAKREARGEKRFTGDELRRLLDASTDTPELRLFILLGLNAGFYSIDCSDLRWSEVKIVGGQMIVDRLRGKTKRRQKFVCWPEVRELIESRPRSGKRVFLTRHGNAWNRDGIDSISLAFNRLRKRAGVTRPGMGFSVLRHTHTSAVGGLVDRNAASVVRGHQIADITRHYDFPSVERLRRITDHARQVLLPSNHRSKKSIGRTSRAKTRDR